MRDRTSGCQVLEVKAARRTGDLDFSRCMKLALRKCYGERPVALGGVFLIEQGKAHIHIMVLTYMYIYATKISPHCTHSLQ